MRIKIDPKNPRRGKTNWEEVRKLSDEEINRRALSDPDCPPTTEEDLKQFRRVPQVQVVRRTLGLTQEEFASRYGLSLRTVQDWEQGRYEPDQAAKTLLRLIEKIPKEVEKALAKPPLPAGARG